MVPTRTAPEFSSLVYNYRCNGETMSTLRFGQQAKSIQNEPVINEITEDDVNDLSDRIRQLKVTDISILVNCFPMLMCKLS